MLTDEEQMDVLDKMAHRWKDAHVRVSKEKAVKEALRAEIRAVMIEMKNESQITTSNFVIKDSEETRKIMMVKTDFIDKYSPQVYDSEGNPRLNSDGTPLLDTTIGTEVYEGHLRDNTYKKFSIKERTGTTGE